MTIPNPPGEQTVAPGEPVASDWGNTVWSQSVQRFDSTADRDAQLAAPDDGQLCYTIAEKTWWGRRDGAWIALDGPVDSQVGSTPTPTNEFGAAYVTYPHPFAGYPIVVAWSGDDGAHAGWFTRIPSADDNAGFGVLAHTAGGVAASTTVRVDWVAFGPRA